MNRARQDAWSREEDMILAETVLRYIKEGKTQLEAFRDVADQLSRTAAACGFRWNATIRKHYDEAIQLAKQERKSGLTDHLTRAVSSSSDNHDTIDSTIRLLKNMQNHIHPDRVKADNQHQVLLKGLQEENDLLKQRLKRYEAAWTEMGKLWEWVSRDKVH